MLEKEHFASSWLHQDTQVSISTRVENTVITISMTTTINP